MGKHDTVSDHPGRTDIGRVRLIAIGGKDFLGGLAAQESCDLWVFKPFGEEPCTRPVRGRPISDQQTKHHLLGAEGIAGRLFVGVVHGRCQGNRVHRTTLHNGPME